MSIVQNGDYYEIVVDKKDDIVGMGIKSVPPNTIPSENIDSSEADPQAAFNKLYQEQGVISLYPANPASMDIVETPADKLNRLKMEIQEFKESMSFMSEQQKQQAKQLGLQGDVVGEIEILERELANVAGIKEFQELFQNQNIPFNPQANIALMKRDIQKKITEDLKSQISGLSSLDKGKGADKQKPGKIEIYMDSEKSKLEEQAKFLELEKRVNLLEEMLGKDQLKKENFPTGVSLLQKADHFQKTLEVLDEAKISDIGKKLENIICDIDKINADKTLQSQQNITPADLKRIHDLNEKVQNIQGISDELPLVVERLESLRLIHEESAGFMMNMSSLSDLHNKVIQQLGTNDNLLQKVQQNLEGNLNTISQNISNIEQRIEKIEKK